MIAATLFSGIGAPEQAMPGWRWAWCAELEPFPSAVLAARHPGSVNLGDVRAHDFVPRAAGLALPTVIVFGSPCQSFSVAGKRLGLDDPRGNLALVGLGVVDRLTPRWFVFENVPGLLSTDEGRDFGTFLGQVDELGYCCAWASLDAQHFGVAQRRERLFVVGHIGDDWRYPAAVLLEPEGLCGDSPPRREAGEGTARELAPSLAGSGCGVERVGESRGQDPVVAWALQERDHKGADSSTKEGHLLVADPLSTSEQFTYTHEGKNFRLRNVVRPGVRRLTPRECERLQGLPDDYTLIRYRGKPAADSPRYRALGNSMAVPVIRWVLSRIELFEREVRPKIKGGRQHEAARV